MYVISVVNYYFLNPNKAYYRTFKRIFEYLKGTRNIALLYTRELITLFKFLNVNLEVITIRRN